MSDRLMLLPSLVHEDSILVRIPEDFGDEEVFRTVTGLVAQVEEEYPETYSRQDIVDILEDHGFESVSFIAGPELD